MNYTHFIISDFCISKEPVPQVIADRILLHHIIPLNAVQNCCPFEVYVSYSTKGQPSGYRPHKWEIQKGRNGSSQHTFGQHQVRILESKGAVDITCEDFKTNKYELLNALIDHTPYLRIAEYNTFFHCDYKDVDNGKRRFYDSSWNFKHYI